MPMRAENDEFELVLLCKLGDVRAGRAAAGRAVRFIEDRVAAIGSASRVRLRQTPAKHQATVDYGPVAPS